MRTAIFAWRRYTPPFLIGGAEVSQRLLAEELARLGWRVIYLGSHEPPWKRMSELEEIKRTLDDWNVNHTLNDSRIRYRWNGVDCHSVPQADISSVLKKFLGKLTCDLVVTSQEGSGILARNARHHAPVAGWIHSISKTGMEVLEGEPDYALATSKFVLTQMPRLDRTNITLFYPPFICPPEAPVAGTEATEDLLMINPVQPKGGELVKQLANLCRERRLTLVEGWWDTSGDFAELPNVRYIPRTYNMEKLYRSHRVLLVPSVVEDAFPRVIIEAGLAGLPTIGSDRGGIPEAISAGGIVLPHNDLYAWISAIRSLDGHMRDSYARTARSHSAQFVRSCAAELTELGIISVI